MFPTVLAQVRQQHPRSGSLASRRRAGPGGRAAGKGRGLASEAGAALRVPGPAVGGRGGAACGRAGGRARLAPRPELRAQVVPQVMGGPGPLGSSRDQRCAP